MPAEESLRHDPTALGQEYADTISVLDDAGLLFPFPSVSCALVNI